MHEDCHRSLFNRRPVVHIVDPDPATCKALSAVFRRQGYRTLISLDASGLFASLERRHPDAVIVNLSLGLDDGLVVLRHLKAAHRGVAVVVLENAARIENVVAAMKAGAADVLAKPIDPGRLVRAVGETLRETMGLGTSRRGRRAVEPRGFTYLTPREREVMQLIAEGASNKEVGRELGISPRTVEVHRARVMEKLGARNAADLARIVLTRDGPALR